MKYFSFVFLLVSCVHNPTKNLDLSKNLDLDKSYNNGWAVQNIRPCLETMVELGIENL